MELKRTFIGRSMILNVLGASRFWHVAKVLIPPNWVLDSYKSITWPFIWKGKMETISRERCCAPVSKGGLNILNFPLKCISLRLSNFLSLRDNFGSEKWHFLARYFLGNRLFRLDNRFNFSRNNIPSSALPSNFILEDHFGSFLEDHFGSFWYCILCLVLGFF